MRRIKTYLIIVNLIFLTGCANKAMPDTYVENYDYQYRQWSDSIAFPKVQQGSDNIVYIYKNGFIYYMEEGNDVLVPLCNKVDCLHDRETDQQKIKECNASVDLEELANINPDKDIAIAKCGDYLYCIPLSCYETDERILYRYALDGTAKDVVYKWDGKSSIIVNWIIHRNNLYYAEKRYYEEDEEIKVECTIKRLSLNTFFHRPETVYTAEENLRVLTWGNLQAYGNYVYFEIISMLPKEGDSQKEENNGYDYDRLYNKTFVSNLQVLLEDVPQAGYFLSDGEYLYFFDDWMEDIDDWLRNPGKYVVYDKDMQIVDTFMTPLNENGRAQRFPVGDRNRMYFTYEKEDGTWGVKCWEKKIGEYRGKTITLTEIMDR